MANPVSVESVARHLKVPKGDIEVMLAKGWLTAVVRDGMTFLDGHQEYIARFIQRFGYGAARGSSTRGGVGAVVEMVRLMRANCPAGFTVDGPKGPRYVAKMGPVLLAKKTGHPVKLVMSREEGKINRCPGASGSYLLF